jgi:formate dehydrogenase subunit delta
MKPEKLVKMANDIASFFEADPERKEAEGAIASHLKRFWAPQMRRQLVAWIDEHGAPGLKDIVRDAVAAHRANLVPPEPPAGAPDRLP